MKSWMNELKQEIGADSESPAVIPETILDTIRENFARRFENCEEADDTQESID